MATFNTPSEWINKPLKVLLVGAGGTGSALLSLLAQMDFNLRQLTDSAVYLDMDVIDGDEVSRFNVGRQAFYPADIGQNKAEVLVKRFNQFTATRWRFGTNYVKPNQISINRNGYDIVITCTDSAKFRYELGQHFKESVTDTLWLDCGNDKDAGQIILGHLGKTMSGKEIGRAHV